MFFEKQYSDDELINKIRNNKNINKYFSIFYERYNSKVFTLCQYLLYNKENVEDIFQETFISFYNNITIKKKKPENPVGYLLNTARNLCMKSNRDNKNHLQLENINPPSFTTNYEDEELIELILEKLELIKQKYREVFILKELQGYSHEQISNICKISISSSKVRLFRAHSMLLKELRPYLEEIKYYE